MVGLDDVVEVLVLRASRTPALLLQLRQGDSVGWRLVSVDDTGLLPVLQAVQRLAKEALGSRRVARRREVEVDGIPVLVEGPVEVGPLTSDLYVSLIDAPARRTRPAPLPAQPFLDLGCVSLNPAVDRRMIDRDAALA